MSVERRERRRCDICGELITGDYHSASRRTLQPCGNVVQPGIWQIQGNWNNTGGGDIDVCQDCWDKMKESK
jgi:hypothetical protein